MAPQTIDLLFTIAASPTVSWSSLSRQYSCCRGRKRNSMRWVGASSSARRRLQSQGKTNPNKVLRSTALESERHRSREALSHQRRAVGTPSSNSARKRHRRPLLIPAYQGGATASGLRGCAEPSRLLLGRGPISGEAAGRYLPIRLNPSGSPEWCHLGTIESQKYYVLYMFPYLKGPVFMWVASPYTARGHHRRYKRMLGFVFLNPMSWDAFIPCWAACSAYWRTSVDRHQEKRR